MSQICTTVEVAFVHFESEKWVEIRHIRAYCSQTRTCEPDGPAATQLPCGTVVVWQVDEAHVTRSVQLLYVKYAAAADDDINAATTSSDTATATRLERVMKRMMLVTLNFFFFNFQGRTLNSKCIQLLS